MSNIIDVGLAFTGGTVLGFLYFLTLWVTLHQLPAVNYPVLVSFASLCVRLTVLLSGFYLIMGGQWERLVLCLLGFLFVRSILMHRWGPHQKLANPAKA